MFGHLLSPSRRSIKKASAAFDPATLSLTGWWRANFGGAPWLGTASTGSSGSRSLAAGDAPLIGTAQNGFDPADFNGSSDHLVTAVNVDSLFSAAAWSIGVLFRADTAQAFGSDEYDNECIIASTGASAAAIGLAFSTSGVSAFHAAGGGWPGVTVACGTGAYHCARAKYDGTDIKLSIDSGGYSSAAAANADQLSSGETLVVGADWFLSQFFDGRVLEVMTADSAISDANFDNIKGYWNARYALAL